MARLEFASKRKMRDAAQAMSIGAMAARGDPKKLKEQLRKWAKETD